MFGFFLPIAEYAMSSSQAILVIFSKNSAMIVMSMTSAMMSMSADCVFFLGGGVTSGGVSGIVGTSGVVIAIFAICTSYESRLSFCSGAYDTWIV